MLRLTKAATAERVQPGWRVSTKRRWLAACVAASLGLAAACSSGDDEASVPTVELSTTSLTTLPPATPTTTEAQTTTIDPRIADIEAAVQEFHEVQQRLLKDPAEDVTELDEVADVELASVGAGFINTLRAEASVVSGGFEVGPIEVLAVDDAQATALACGLDALETTDAAGVVLIPSDEDAYWREYVLRNRDGVWIVESIRFPSAEKESCAL